MRKTALRVFYPMLLQNKLQTFLNPERINRVRAHCSFALHRLPGRVCTDCLRYAWSAAASDCIVSYVYLHHVNMMLREEIYRGQESAAKVLGEIKTEDYYVLGLRGQDVDMYVGERMSLPKRISKLRQKFSCHTEPSPVSCS